MATPQPQIPKWVWDENRKDYYYHCPTENCWVYYSSGQKVYPIQTPQDQPRTIEVPHGPFAGVDQFLGATENSPECSHVTVAPALEESTPASPLTTVSTNSRLRYEDGDYMSGNSPALRSRHDSRGGTSDDPQPPRKPIVINGTPETGNHEKINPQYKVRVPGHMFFKLGVVFKVLWSEPGGNDVRRIENSSFATEAECKSIDTRFTEGRFGEKVFTEFRWFVVIREGPPNSHFCTCLRIQTFNGRGVGQKVKSHHAIIYTGWQPPEPEPDEIAQPGEEPMGDPIRVLPFRPTDNMKRKSRINFYKPYTVEHNVKVYDFGEVDPQDMWKLDKQWKKAWGIDCSRRNYQPQASYPSTPGVAPEYAYRYPGGYGHQPPSAYTPYHTSNQVASIHTGTPTDLSALTANFQNLGVSPNAMPSSSSGYPVYSPYGPTPMSAGTRTSMEPSVSGYSGGYGQHIQPAHPPFNSTAQRSLHYGDSAAVQTSTRTRTTTKPPMRGYSSSHGQTNRSANLPSSSTASRRRNYVDPTASAGEETEVPDEDDYPSQGRSGRHRRHGP